ncbi:hypothetical protein PIB30_069598, partial [Stylosanthes scabra]|nr:hypothetical protein [Stylosanthes scabra]
ICVILKVHLECCEACSRRVNRRLRKVKGVMDVKIDREEGLVTVFGDADSSELMEAIKKVGGKKAEIFVQPEDQPTEPSCTCQEKIIPDDSDNGSACAEFGEDDVPLPLSFGDHGASLGFNNNVASNASYHHYPHNNASYHHYPENNGGGGGGYFQGTGIPVPADARFGNDYNDCIPHPPPMGHVRPQQPPYQNSYYHYHHHHHDANGCTIS